MIVRSAPENTMRFAATFLLLTAATVICAAPPDDAVKQDRQKIQGRWKTVELQDGGKKRPDDHIKDWMLVVEGERMTAKDGDDILDQATFKLDPSKKPAGIQISYTTGPEKGKVLRGIYLLDGDTLKICVAAKETELPKDFASREGTDQTLVVMKRDKGGK
jgi:uncharacterized protein (TIGR03067 family)